MSLINKRFVSYGSTIETEEHTRLGLEPTEKETKDALDSFKPLKAPGPDDLHQFFYQKYWNETKNCLVKFCKDF